MEPNFRMNTTESKKIRALALRCAAAQRNVAVQFAKVLYEIFYCKVEVGNKDVTLVQAWGFDSFHDYVENELGMHGSAGAKYVRVWDRLVVEGELEPRKLPLSITKLVQLSRLPKNVLTSWAKKAEKLSCCDLENAVNEYLGVGDQYQNLNIRMRWSDRKRLYTKLKNAKEIFGVETYGEALSKAIEQWAEIADRTNKLRKSKAA